VTESAVNEVGAELHFLSVYAAFDDDDNDCELELSRR